MAKIRDYRVVTYPVNTSPWVAEMPTHEIGDLLVVFAAKDGTPGFNTSTNPGGGSYTRHQGAATAGSYSLCETLVAGRTNETWSAVLATTDTGCLLVAAVQDVDGTNPIDGSWITAAEDNVNPFSGYSGASTSSANCLIFHMLGGDGSVAAQILGPSVNMFCGDAANGSLTVAYTFQQSAGAITQPWFIGHASDDTKSITLSIKSSNAGARQAYADPSLYNALLVRPLVGLSTAYTGDSWPTTLANTVFGKDVTLFLQYVATTTTYTDYTSGINDWGSAYVPTSLIAGDMLYVGSTEKFINIVGRVTVASTFGSLIWEYWDGSSWVTTGVTEATNDNFLNIGAAVVLFNNAAQTAMQTTSINGSAQLYFARARVAVSWGTPKPNISQIRVNGAGLSYLVSTASADNGTNPFSNAFAHAGASSISLNSGCDAGFNDIQFSTGILLGTFRGALARDLAIDCAKPLPYTPGGGLQVALYDASNNHRCFIVHSQGAISTNIDDRNVFAVDMRSGSAVDFSTLGTLGSTIKRMGFFSGGYYGAVAVVWSMLIRVTEIGLAGGSSSDPFDFDDIAFVLNNCVGMFPLFRQSGTAAKIYAPLQFGGVDRCCVSCNLSTFNFPTKYDGLKYFDWNAADNVAGINFYPKTGDVLKFTNCIFNGGSPYRFEFDSSSATDATIDFDGSVVIGATVTLRYVGTPFAAMTFISCPSFVPNSADLEGCYFDSTKVVTAYPHKIESCGFVSSGTGHAIELTAAGSFTLDSLTYVGFAATDGSTGNEAIYNNSGGAVTLTISGGDIPSIRNGTGASTTLIAGAVSVSVTVQKADGTKIQSANVFLAAADSGPYPFQETVTIVNSGTTATVAHTGHGLASNDKVLITGASLAVNNGVFQITVSNVNEYAYTMASAPGSSPTGTIKSTFVLIKGLTDSVGVISMSRVFVSDQPVYGWARKSSAQPFYKEGPLSGSVDSVTGAILTSILAVDE